MPQLMWTGILTAVIPQTLQISAVCVLVISCIKCEGILWNASKSISLRLCLSHCHFHVPLVKPKRDPTAVQRKAW